MTRRSRIAANPGPRVSPRVSLPRSRWPREELPDAILLEAAPVRAARLIGSTDARDPLADYPENHTAAAMLLLGFIALLAFLV